RARLAETGDGAVHEARVRFGELLVAQPVAGEIAELVVLQQHVGFRSELAHELRALGLRDIDRNGLLAAVGAAEIRRFARLLAVPVADVGRRERARIVALARALDLDHLRAEVAQVLPRPRPSQDTRHVQYPNVR